MKRIFYTALFFVAAAILLSTSFPVNNSRAADTSKIAIAYSSCVLGYLEPCG